MCLWSDQSEFTALFMEFNLWTGSGISFFNFVVNF